MKTIILNIYKFLLLSVLLLFCWRCAESDLEIEREMLPVTELNLLSGEVTVQDLLRENSPIEFQRATGKIWNSGIGRRLLKSIESIGPKGGHFIYFVAILDPDGHPAKGYGRMIMRYAGNGEIRYNFDAWKSEYNDGPLFHEYFHMYQNQNRPPYLSRNNEIEASLAQYLYADESGIYIEMLDKDFTECIIKLANYINKRTGLFRRNANLDKFYETYQKALNFLADHPEYNGDGWISQDYRSEHPFPHIVKLLKEDK